MLIRGQLLVISEAGPSKHQPHYGTNNGTETAEIVVVYAGVKGKPITVLEAAPASSVVHE